MTEAEAVARFRAELSALLTKWGAEILAQERPDDRWGEFRSHEHDIYMLATIRFTRGDGREAEADIDLGLCVGGDA
jgi:hypothetical protein